MIEDWMQDKWDAFMDVEANPRPRPRRAAKPATTELVEAGGDESGFQTTYKPGRFEAVWLLQSLRAFYDQNLLTDVLALVKGGKEANVYRCAGHPTTGHEFVAAKVYRPRNLRNLSNDRMYKEGRPVLNADGSVVKSTDDRILRAIGKKTDFGMQVAHTSWLMYEFTTLERLHNEGAAVPVPVGSADNALLLGYIGDETRAASTLAEVRLERDEAEGLFREVLRNIELMTRLGLAHGDLSAYNILYWQGHITLIDFPQVTHLTANSQGRFILERDITRVCDYFTRQGVPCDPGTILADLWNRYIQD